jgi:phosphoribosylanthranilate isomerase
MTYIKFCGMTREDDVINACELGVDAIGFVMWPDSPRFVAAAHVKTLVARMPRHVVPVGVTVAPTSEQIAAARDAGVRVLQIHGAQGTVEPGNLGALELWLASTADDSVDAIPHDITVLLDAQDPVRHGGTGRTIDWSRAAAIAARRRVILAGGLTPANVRAAIQRVRPFGVDVASGIEVEPGKKSVRAMQSFVAAVREATS